MTYKPSIVLAYYHSCNLPEPMFEYLFVNNRMWRFDLAWPVSQLALEVQGGLFTGGAHVRGSRLVKEHEKLNAAAERGWRILYCQPRDVCTLDVVKLIRRALDYQLDPP